MKNNVEELAPGYYVFCRCIGEEPYVEPYEGKAGPFKTLSEATRCMDSMDSERTIAGQKFYSSTFVAYIEGGANNG